MKFGTTSKGLGDTLLLTGVCKYLKNPTVQILKENERFSFLFDKLADVEITDDINNLLDIGSGHYTTRKLRGIFEYADGLDNRPIVLFSDKESEEWADEFIKNIINPIIICPVASERTGGIKNERSFSDDLTNHLINSCTQQGLTPILHIFEAEDKYQNINKIPQKLDLKKYVCLLRKCGRFIGCNTGDMHLAVALNCLCTIFQPKDIPFFSQEEWSYNHPSISYYNF